MRMLKRNHTITILGKKIGNTYIKSEEGISYPLTDTKFTKIYKDYEKAFWILKRYYFQWRVLKKISLSNKQ